jgi:hypothetical protein
VRGEDDDGVAGGEITALIRVAGPEDHRAPWAEHGWAGASPHRTAGRAAGPDARARRPAPAGDGTIAGPFTAKVSPRTSTGWSRSRSAPRLVAAEPRPGRPCPSPPSPPSLILCRE